MSGGMQAHAALPNKTFLQTAVTHRCWRT